MKNEEKVLIYLTEHAGEWCAASDIAMFANITRRQLGSILKNRAGISKDATNCKKYGFDTCYKVNE